VSIVIDLERARAAVERRNWSLAYDLLRQADDLGAEDTMALATSAYMTGDLNAAVRALQRGYQERIRDHDPLGAVHFASWLGVVLNVQGEHAVGAGWVARAQRLLESEPEDIVERGQMLSHEFHRRLAHGDLPGAAELAAQMVETGRRFQNPDLTAQGLMSRGRVLIYLGRVPEGLALLDEAMVGLTAGEVSPIIAGLVYCSVIEACQELSDYGRASSWTRALARWCDDQPGVVPFTGQCALHKGQILRLTGAYDDALSEFSVALRRYELWGTPAPAGLALIERADVLRIRGELEAAETAYRQASDLGHDPQPGLALSWLARGRAAAALSAVRRVLAEVPDPVHRSKLLPAAVEVLLAGGQLDEAKPLADELAGIAAAFGGAAVAAMAAYAAATVQLADGQAADALRLARESFRLWSEIDSPYEVARSRVVVAQALRKLEDEDSAEAELDAARHTFTELGAVPALRDVERLRHRTTPGGLTERELEVLRLVAEGRGNPEIARVLFLSQKTVARHLSNIFVKLNVSSRTAAAAYAHAHRLLS
jgi:ATP/maltotriose-dependent transcriptional regulator MalT